MFKAIAAPVLAALIAASAAGTASAQEQTTADQGSPWEFIVTSGTVVPTGAQREAIRRGKVTAAQVSYLARPGFAVTASVGWGRTRDLALADQPRLDMFTYDVGAEFRASRWLEGGLWSLSPFAGVGAGGRSYNHRSLAVDATHNVAGYASVGGELGIGSRVRMRLEARDYVTGFKPLDGSGHANARNDVTVLGGLRIRVR
jgi:hypothetical protein